ncbi:hypothetical protein SAMN05444362_106110 [Dysgonomonas macrotermitis]|uniref:Uncharacterized protein n=1 Tax=Dysgonomonas macrotermitis TaxID=1346286 RepID=A0A1M5BM09_9BACT|nr:hypothetical protein SAMN05444362_106110 [Dysgonomonas macrotermitis]
MEKNDITETKQALKELKRKNRRQRLFLMLTAFQIGSIVISYYLGRSHK